MQPIKSMCNKNEGKQCRHCRYITGAVGEMLNDDNTIGGCGLDGHIIVTGDPACDAADIVR